MYIPELDALIFLATEFSGGSVDQPSLKAGVKALHEAAGGTHKCLVPDVSIDASRLDSAAPAMFTPQEAINLEKHQSVVKCQKGLAGGHALTFLSSWDCRLRSVSQTTPEHDC